MPGTLFNSKGFNVKDVPSGPLYQTMSKPLTKTPDDVIAYIMTYMNLQDLLFFRNASSRHQKIYEKHAFFYAQRLLELVMAGKATEALNLLKAKLPSREGITTCAEECIALIPQDGVEKHNHRRWKSISVIAFLAYSGDYYLLEEMINIIPRRFYPYILQEIHSVPNPLHDLGNLNLAYNNYNSKYDNVKKCDKAIGKLYLSIGEAQKALPIIILQWITSPSRNKNSRPSEQLCLTNQTPLTQIYDLGILYVLRMYEYGAVLFIVESGECLGDLWYSFGEDYISHNVEHIEVRALHNRLLKKLEQIKEKLHTVPSMFENFTLDGYLYP